MGNMWKKEFNKLYFDYSYEKQDKMQASEIKRKNFPPSLYKYTKAEYAIKTLQNNLLKISTAMELNDPFEGELTYSSNVLFEYNKKEIVEDFFEEPQFCLTNQDKENILKSNNPLNKLLYVIYNNESNFGADYTWDEFKNLSIDSLIDFQDYKIKNFNNELKKRVYLISLSENNNINPIWAHYADNHRGVCLEYDLRDNEEESVEITNENKFETLRDSLLYECCFPVDYVEHYDFSKDLELMHDDTHNKLKILEEPFIKKSIDWSYEKEWRIILNKDRLSSISKHLNLNLLEEVNSINFINFPKPKAIYLGLNLESSYEEKIIGICKDKKIPVYKMKKDKSKYNLTYEQKI